MAINVNATERVVYTFILICFVFLLHAIGLNWRRSAASGLGIVFFIIIIRDKWLKK